MPKNAFSALSKVDLKTD